MIRIMILSAVVIAVFCYAADKVSAKGRDFSKEKKAAEMKQYWLVLLKKGTNLNHDSATIEAIQAAHMRNINNLAQSGTLLVGGPVGNASELRGIFILDVADSLTAASLVQKDSAIVTGRLRAEIYPWWTQKGAVQFK